MSKKNFGLPAAWATIVGPLIPFGIALDAFSKLTSLFALLTWYGFWAILAVLSKYDRLEDKQKPRVELLWGRGHPYIHSGTEIETLWRIGINNRSTALTVSDIQAKLIEMEPSVNV